MRRMYSLLAAVFCLPILGCFSPFAYPTFAYTGRIKLDTPVGEVHAFRVDGGTYRGLSNLPEEDWLEELSAVPHGSLTMLPLTGSEEVPAQIKPSWTYGWLLFGSPAIETRSWFAVVLYRPGYEILKLGSSRHSESIDWKPVHDLAAQEEVADSLFWRYCERYGEAPDFTAIGDRATLLIGANEYERLAGQVTEPGNKQRLLEKANHLLRVAAHLASP